MTTLLGDLTICVGLQLESEPSLVAQLVSRSPQHSSVKPQTIYCTDTDRAVGSYCVLSAHAFENCTCTSSYWDRLSNHTPGMKRYLEMYEELARPDHYSTRFRIWFRSTLPLRLIWSTHCCLASFWCFSWYNPFSLIYIFLNFLIYTFINSNRAQLISNHFKLFQCANMFVACKWSTNPSTRTVC